MIVAHIQILDGLQISRKFEQEMKWEKAEGGLESRWAWMTRE